MKANGEKILTILYLAAAADGHIDESEMTMFDKIRHTYVALSGISNSRLEKITHQCLKNITDGESIASLIRRISIGMNENLRNITYALAVEVCAANFNISNLEADFLSILKDTLGVSDSISEATLLSANVRYEFDRQPENH